MAPQLRGLVDETATWWEAFERTTGFKVMPWQERIFSSFFAAQLEPEPTRVIPRSWHEAWLDTTDAPGRSDVPDFTAGRFPTSCDDRHEWHLSTAQGTRDTTTWCTRPAFHTGRHAQGSLTRVNGSPSRDRVIAVWQYP